MSAKPLREKLQELFSMREEKKALEKSLKELKSSFSELEEQICEMMLDDEVQSMGVENMATFSLSRSEHPRIVDNELLRQRLIEAGDEGMLTLNPQTMKSWWRYDLTDEQREDPGKYGIAVFRESRISITAK